jgi:hypothetical protein
VFEPSLVRDSVGARPQHATLRIAAAGAIATMVGSIVLARAVGDKRLSDTLLEAGRQAVHHQAAGASAGSVSSRQHLNSTGAASARQSVIANVER